MKHIKQFEIYIDAINRDEYPEELKKHKLKLGDYVRIQDNILKITAIDTNDDTQPYFVSAWDSNNKGVYNGVGYWISGENLKSIPDYEMDAMKYNL
jgi:hypothetical protein